MSHCRNDKIISIAHREERKESGKMTDGLERLVSLTPLSGEVTEEDLEGEVDENGEGEVLLLQPLFEQFERGGSVVGGGSKLGDEVDEDKRLDVCGDGRKASGLSEGGGSAEEGRDARLSLQISLIIE
jgi:hypothetical protein